MFNADFHKRIQYNMIFQKILFLIKKAATKGFLGTSYSNIADSSVHKTFYFYLFAVPQRICL